MTPTHLPPPGTSITEKDASLITILAGQEAQAIAQKATSTSLSDALLPTSFDLSPEIKLSDPTLGMMITLEDFWAAEKTSPLPNHQRMACEIFCFYSPKSASQALRAEGLPGLATLASVFFAENDLSLEVCRQALRWFNGRMDAIYGVTQPSPSSPV